MIRNSASRKDCENIIRRWKESPCHNGEVCWALRWSLRNCTSLEGLPTRSAQQQDSCWTSPWVVDEEAAEGSGGTPGSILYLWMTCRQRTRTESSWGSARRTRQRTRRISDASSHFWAGGVSSPVVQIMHCRKRLMTMWTILTKTSFRQWEEISMSMTAWSL